MSDTIEQYMDIILACQRNAINERDGARIAAYRIVDEIVKALTSDAAVEAVMMSLYPSTYAHQYTAELWPEAKDAMTAALEAAGIVDGDDDE